MGGHSSAICSEHWDTLQLLMGIDQDPAALLMAGKRLHAARAEGRAVLVSGNFEDMGRLAAENGIEKESVDGILLDIGTSSLQLDEASILKSPVYRDFIVNILGRWLWE
jgi:16S rRNA (cytosine1402-N4)-methyltransferase